MKEMLITWGKTMIVIDHSQLAHHDYSKFGTKCENYQISTSSPLIYFNYYQAVLHMFKTFVEVLELMINYFLITHSEDIRLNSYVFGTKYFIKKILTIFSGMF